MTREMNKPDWELSRYKCGNNRCPIHYYTAFINCDECNNIRKLDDWIKPYIDSINERFKQCG